MRCPDCNRFASLDLGEPELEELSVDDDGVVTGTVRICRTCAECGLELKEATLDLVEDMVSECEKHTGEGHELVVDDTGIEPIEEAVRRKPYFGAALSFKITCTCGEDKKRPWSVEGTVSDKEAASAMDEMV